jgi:hypothetical protein
MCSTKYVIACAGCAIILSLSLGSSATYTIPADKLDPNKVYYGTTSAFQKPGEVNYEDLVKATPEYKEVKGSKIESGTGKYWILMSQATDRTVKAISVVGEESDYDLIAAQGYLGKLEPSIPADNITDMVKKKIEKPKATASTKEKSAKPDKSSSARRVKKTN